MAARKDNLTRYREKRDFTKTEEPEGKVEKGAHYRYLIQKHAATRLHYDFRLELDGVLKSWAVTRGPSLDPADKRLAVEVEDHPVSYGSFEGTIPKGQYGGGTVMLWDEGYWEPVGDPHKGLKQGKLVFLLHGKRLHGEWTLVRMREREKDKGRHNWLLIKHHDKEAREGIGEELLNKYAKSVTSGRSMEQIAKAQDAVWQSKSAGKKVPSAKSSIKKKAKGKLPVFTPPQLATLTDELPKGKEWVHELKFDGYRTLAYINGDDIRLYTRTGLDWTKKFQSLLPLLGKIKADNAILDGEIVVPDEEGHSSFRMLQDALSREDSSELQYYVFDLLHLNGTDITALPLLERKEALHALLKKDIGGRIIYSEHFTEGAPEILHQLCRQHMEGLVSKRADAPYVSGRAKYWLKTKCQKRQEFVIGGFTLPTHEQRGIGALLLGYYRDGELIYAGKVGTGFDESTSRMLRKKLNPLKQKTMAFTAVTPIGKRGALWVKPQLVCEVAFSEWTQDGHLRHPSFQGLREDKPADEVQRDEPEKGKTMPFGKTATKTKNAKATVEGIAISHPDRVIYPGSSITKLALAEYYEKVSEAILPYVANRPLSMVRCPEGTGEPCFFQRHIAQGQSPYLHDVPVTIKGRQENYLMIEDAKGLLTLVQWGVIELHPWGCLADKPDMPDRIIFDLDPDPEVAWKHMIEGAQEVRMRMEEFGLQSFLKTTGGKGLHVVVPLSRKYKWPAIKAFARAVAESMQHDNPQRYISKSSKEARRGKIFVDYLRNDLTSTAVAPFSARAREGAPVSMTLAWEDLTAKLKPSAFTIETAPAFLEKRRQDPWEDFLRLKQQLSARHLKALGIEPV